MYVVCARSPTSNSHQGDDTVGDLQMERSASCRAIPEARQQCFSWVQIKKEDDGVTCVIDKSRKATSLAVATGPVNLVMVFGRAREGKSFLLNKLAGENIFRVSHSNAPCTVGADLTASLTPLSQFATGRVELLGAEEPLVGFVDVEGQGDEGQAYDVQLVCPLLLVSRVAVFNWRGRIAKEDILQKLNVVVEASTRVQAGAAGAQGPAVFGHLFIVLRDVVDDDGIETMLLAAEDRDGPAAEARNCIRAKLKRAFESITIVALPPPITDTNLLDTGAFDPSSTTSGFNAAMAALRQSITRKLASPQLLAGCALTGSRISELLPLIAQELNKSKAELVPRSLFEEAERRLLGRARDEALRQFKVSLFALKANGAVGKSALQSTVSAAKNKALLTFAERTKGSMTSVRDAAQAGLEADVKQEVDEATLVIQSLVSKRMREAVSEAEQAFKVAFVDPRNAAAASMPPAALQQLYDQQSTRAVDGYRRAMQSLDGWSAVADGEQGLRRTYGQHFSSINSRNNSLLAQEERERAREREAAERRRQEEAERQRREAEERRRRAEEEEEAERRRRRCQGEMVMVFHPYYGWMCVPRYAMGCPYGYF